MTNNHFYFVVEHHFVAIFLVRYFTVKKKIVVKLRLSEAEDTER